MNHRSMNLGRRAVAAALLLACVPLAACAPRVSIKDETAPSSSQLWAPPPSTQRETTPPKPAYEVPEEIKAKAWGLSDVLDVALRNNPVTRSAWFDARAAAARLGMADAAYYPKVNLDTSMNYKSTRRTDTDNTSLQSTMGPTLGLSWLILDFGSRAAAEEGARQTLLAANWTQNGVIQDVVLQTQKAYYLYLASKALRDARQQSLDRAQTNLRAAEARHDAGVVTIADVLQAKTAASQAKLALDSAAGSIATTRGALASSMGLPATIDFDIEELPKDVPYEAVSSKVDDLIADALSRRPDLEAARAQAASFDAAVKKAEGEGLPTLTFNANTGITYYAVNGSGSAGGTTDRREDVFSSGIVLTFPLFTGYSQSYNVERTRAEAESAKARLRSQEQLAVFQVFASYNILNTASQKVRTSDDLTASAEQSETVALGRYTEGVGTILDLVTAQAALADAKSQAIQSRWEWYTALAQLAHDTGLLDLQGNSRLLKQ